MMPCTGVMAMTTTATDCVWSFPGVAGAPEEALVGSEVLQEADMDLHPDAQSTGSLCQVSVSGGKKMNFVWWFYFRHLKKQR